MKILLVVCGAVLSLICSNSEAAWFQYHTTTRQVLGVFALEEDTRPLPDTATIEDPSITVATVVWPTPAGCAKGRKEWALLSPGSTLPLVLNPAMTFFRCHVVTDLAELRLALKNEIERAIMIAVPTSDVTGNLLSILASAELRCTTVTAGDVLANTNGTCNSIRSNNLAIMGKMGTLAEVLTLQSTVITLHTDMENLKTAKGW